MGTADHTFSNRLLETVKRLKLNNKKFAEKVGISENAATNYLKKGRVPEPNILVRVARSLGVSIDWLLTGEDLIEILPYESFSVEDSSPDDYITADEALSMGDTIKTLTEKYKLCMDGKKRIQRELDECRKTIRQLEKRLAEHERRAPGGDSAEARPDCL